LVSFGRYRNLKYSAGLWDMILPVMVSSNSKLSQIKKKKKENSFDDQQDWLL
jgi:hypothetical protein